MDTNLKNRIGTYSGIAGAVLATNVSNAQIIYVDVNPDTIVARYSYFTHPFNLDLDTDGITDFQFKVDNLFGYTHTFPSSGGSSSYYVDAIIISPTDSNAVLNRNQIIAINQINCLLPNYLLTDTLLNNESISGFTSGWHNEVSSIRFFNDCSGGWPLNCEYFIGIEFFSQHRNHYGWLRLNFQNNKLVLKDYAYNLTPNAPIRAGQKLTSPPLSSLGEPWLYTLRTGNNFSLNIENSTGISKISVSNLLGQVIINREIYGSDFDFSLDEKGIFILEVISDNRRLTKKIFVY